MSRKNVCKMNVKELNVPVGISREDIKVREKIIKDFYASWIAEHPDKKVWNDNLGDQYCVTAIGNAGK